jgi:hypothetical protein
MMDSTLLVDYRLASISRVYQLIKNNIRSSSFPRYAKFLCEQGIPEELKKEFTKYYPMEAISIAQTTRDKQWYIDIITEVKDHIGYSMIPQANFLEVGEYWRKNNSDICKKNVTPLTAQERFDLLNLNLDLNVKTKDRFKTWPIELMTEDMLIRAVEINASNIQYIPEHRLSQAICEAAVKKSSGVIKLIPKEYITEEMCHEALKNGYSFLDSIPEDMISPSLKLKALLKNKNSRKYIEKKGVK